MEPIVGLLVAVSIVLQARTLKNQKASAADRVEQKSILASQNDALANIQAAVIPSPPPSQEGQIP